MSDKIIKRGRGDDLRDKALGLKPVRHNPNLARQYKDASDAEQRVKEHAAASWYAGNGKALREAELGAKESRREADHQQKQLTKAREKRDGLNERINMARHRDGDENAPAGKDVPFSDWNWYDKLVASACGGTMVLLLALGVINVATTILGSGIPVFLEQPYLAWMLGGLVPAAAMSIKSGYHLLDLDTSRRHYANGMFITSGLLIFIWIILFALSFEGVTAEIEWDAFADGSDLSGEGDSVGTLRNIVQILGEIVIGASLFLVVDRIQATYSSSYSAKNPKWTQANKRVAELEGPAAEALNRANTDEARVRQMQAARDVYVGEAIAILSDMQSRR